VAKFDRGGFNPGSAMKTKSPTDKSGERKNPSFGELLATNPDLSGLRAEYARKPALKRRKAAEWAYDGSLADSSVSAAVARIPGGGLPTPEWPPGFAALAIDPEYAPAVLTVGCHEYGSGRQSEGMGLLLHLTELSPETPDWVEIIDRAGEFLVEAKAAEDARRLYEVALKVRPRQQEFITGMGWALCRAGKQGEALPWMEQAVANAPDDSAALSDYGWALTELGRFDEAQPILEKAARLAPSDGDLPANNLARLRQLREECRRLS
jgi:tetratricopeptide (TPR) repeat protein